MADEDDEEAEDCDIKITHPMVPHPPSISKTAKDTATRRLLATWTSLIPTLHMRHLSQRCTTRPWHRSLLHSEMEPSLWPGFATPLKTEANPGKTVAEPVPETS